MTQAIDNPMNRLIDLVAEAELTLGFLEGTGLGAAYLTSICVIFMSRSLIQPERLSSILRAGAALRRKNELHFPSGKA